MEEKLSFKQYLESKEKLREAVTKTPQRVATYSVRKYCKLIIGESKDDKSHITLKPSHKITVDWLYEDIDNPTPVSLKFAGLKDTNAEDEYSTYWEGSKLIKWLNRNAREETNS